MVFDSYFLFVEYICIVMILIFQKISFLVCFLSDDFSCFVRSLHALNFIYYFTKCVIHGFFVFVAFKLITAPWVFVPVVLKED